ncbi:hypothetical protein BTA51_21480 [Hahella sp. CCB-MM4]|uniref:DUF4381 domain-containing protein n=1 Tax=Hahella sp. (strain CCB-MM4) TaxID=1926491 RepID=UPI000BC90467|nr:DUF4381 domain-containing protein [Hahella sp. CCB-MM4]OZG71224.1 hypothetical protein BTA51_21480 [Hahella sp. CCB-MM4]
MSLVQQLQLNDVIEPTPVANWPVAPGWWIVYGLAILLVVLGILWLIKLSKQRANQKRTLAALQQCWEQHHATSDFTGFRQTANLVLKRHCLQLGHRDIAAMPATSWQSFLQKKLPEKYHTDIADFCGSLYRPQITTESEAHECRTRVQQWIRRLKC